MAQVMNVYSGSSGDPVVTFTVASLDSGRRVSVHVRVSEPGREFSILETMPIRVFASIMERAFRG